MSDTIPPRPAFVLATTTPLGGWTAGDMLVWYSGETLYPWELRLTNCDLVSGDKLPTGSGLHLLVRPRAAGSVAVEVAGKARLLRVYDPPRPGPVPT